ncbi:APC family permease, partial [Lactobacillus nasalidis]
MKKQISFGQALATVVGSVIGAGVFFKVGSISQSTGSASASILVWILAGVISICSGLTVSEIAAALNVNGAIEYLDYSYGNIWGFLFGWAEMAVYFPAQIAALASIFGQQFVTLFGLPAGTSRLIAFGVVLLLFLINLLGTGFSAKMQSVITVIKLIPLFLIIVFAFSQQNVAVSLWPVTVNSSSGWAGGISQGLLSALFAFEGWIIVTNLAKEMKHPEKDLARAIIFGLSLVTVVYVLVNYAFMTVLPFDKIIGNSNTAYYASLKLFGQAGGKIVTVGILLSVYGACNGFMLTGMRTPYILAQADRLPGSQK